MNKPQLNTDQAAEFLGVSRLTLVKWRCTRRHEIPYYKIGKRVKYAESDLLAFIESRRVDGDK